jgi:magnesium transporter
VSKEPDRPHVLSVGHRFRKRLPAVGAHPGSLAPGSDALPTKISLIDYDSETHERRDVKDVEELTNCLASQTVSWIDVQGLGDEPVLRRIAEIFSIHPLALEDAVNVPSRPKSESYTSNHLIVSRLVRMENEAVIREQITFVIGPNYLITFQEKYGDVFDPVRKRTQTGTIMRTMGPDYLAYALIDTAIDGFYPVLEHYGNLLESFEDGVLQGPDEDLVHRIFSARRDLLAMLRSMWPTRDTITSLLHDESPFIRPEVDTYLRDCLDHATQIAEVMQSYIDLAGQLMELYMSSISNRMNEVMKTLTIIASIFIPLSFVAGMYGMNFVHMPELKLWWAYPAVLAIMALIAGGLIMVFRRRGWIGSGTSRSRSH